MLSTVTVNRIAHELLDHARRSAFGITDPSGAPVARIYRCEDLARLPQGMQQEIVGRATRATYRNPATILVVMLGTTAIFHLWLAALDLFGSALGLSWLVGGAIALPALLPLLLPLLIRPAVRRIAARIGASWPVAAEWQSLARSAPRSPAFSGMPD